MATVPGRCRRCGRAVEGAGGIKFSGGSTVRILGSGSTVVCPHCGGTADLALGHYTADAADSLVLVSGPQWTIDIIQELAAGLRRIVDEKPADPEGALRDLNSDLADRVEAAVRAGLAAEGKPASQRRRFAKTWQVIRALLYILAFVRLEDVESTVESNIEWIVERTQTVLGHLAEVGEVLAPEDDAGTRPPPPAAPDN